jgi:hypothetical protein
MKTLIVLALTAAFVSVPAKAQNFNMNFDAIAKNAREKTELNLAGPMLDMLRQKVLKAGDQEKQALFAAVDQVAVYSYQFEKPGEYADSDLNPLRKQVEGSAQWSRMLNVKEKDEDTRIYVSMQGGKQTGFLLISAEAKEVSVILVSGSIRLAQLKELVDSTVQYKDLAQ